MQSIMGTTPTITAAPSEENLDTTSASPSEEPPSADCKDSSLTFKVLWNGRNRKKTCSFANSATKCDVAGVSEICSKTCNSCDTCADTSLRFKVALSSTKSRFKDCAWVEAKKTEERCALEGVKEACCATCAAFA